jgi:hypothetical protein
MAKKQVNDSDWTLFTENVSVFSNQFESLAKTANKNLLALLSIHHLVSTQQKYVYETFGKEENAYFEDILAELTKKINPEVQLKKLYNTVLNLKLSDKSFLRKKYALKVIRGKYLGLADPMTSKIKSEKTGAFENKQSHISFKFGFPTPYDIINIAFYDLDETNEY